MSDRIRIQNGTKLLKVVWLHRSRQGRRRRLINLKFGYPLQRHIRTQQIGWGLVLYIYACLVNRMDSSIMGGSGEPYFTCNVLIPHPMIHLLLSTLPLPGLRVYTSCWYDIWDTRREVQGARYGAYARGVRYRVRGMRHLVWGTWYVARGMEYVVLDSEGGCGLEI
jgi:hypothetical protein